MLGQNWQGVAAAIWVSGDGSYTIYTKPASTWVAPPGETAQLVQLTGSINADSASYLLKMDNGAIVGFRADGWQAWTQDLIGNRTNYSYSTLGTGAKRLLKIKDPTGVAFEFAYGSSGNALAKVTSIRVRANGAGSTRLVDSLTYDSNGRLGASWAAVNGTPAGARDTTTFAYNGTTTFGAYLTSITDPRSTAPLPVITTFTYDNALFSPSSVILPPNGQLRTDTLYFRDPLRRVSPRVGYGRSTTPSTLQPADRLITPNQMLGTSVNGDARPTDFTIDKFLATTWVRRIAPTPVWLTIVTQDDFGGDDIRRIERDTLGRVTKIVQGWRASDQPDSVLYHYDAKNRLDRMIRPTKAYYPNAPVSLDTFNFTFDSVSVATTGGWCNRMLRSTDAMGGVDTVAFGAGTGPAQCLPVKVKDASKDSTLFRYGPLTVGNAAGARPVSTTDPVGLVDSVVYHAGTWNTQKVIRSVDTATTTMFYNGYGWVDSIVDPVGARTRFIRDSLGRVTHQKTGTGSFAPVTRTTYLPGGLTKQVEVYASEAEDLTTPQGTIQVTKTFYSRLGEVDSVLYPGTRPTSRRVWNRGKGPYSSLTREYPGNGGMIAKVLDWQGRPEAVSYTPVKPSLSWDGEGYFGDSYSQSRWNLAVLSDAQMSTGQNYNYTYDNKGEVTWVAHNDAIFPGGVGNVSTRSMIYSATGQVISDSQSFADGVSIKRTHQYNRRGQRILSIETVRAQAGHTLVGKPMARTTFVYDSTRGGLLTQVRAETGDSLPNMVEFARADYTYGAGNRLVTRAVILDSTGNSPNRVTTTYSYDNKGQVDSLRVFNYTTNPNDSSAWYRERLHVYNKAGELLFYKQRSMAAGGNGDITLTYATDGTRRLSGQASSAGTSSSWNYDVFGNQIRVLGQPDCATNDTSTFGPDNRLLSRRQPFCQNYHWYWSDHTGNRIGATDSVAGVGAVNTRMSYTAANQLAWSFTNSLGYTIPGKYDIDWNWYGADGMREITEVQTTFNPNAYLVAVPGSGIRTYYSYDGSDVALTLSRNTGTTIFEIRHRFLNGGLDHQIAVRYGNGTSLALIADRQGSTIGAVRADGLAATDVIGYSLTAFGSAYQSVTPGTSSTETGFTGASTPTAAPGGLTYLRNRWYDPQTGRFLTQDPIGLAGGVNLYAYAGNNPIGFSDPFGLCTAEDKKAGNCTQSGVGSGEITGWTRERVVAKAESNANLVIAGFSALQAGWGALRYGVARLASVSTPYGAAVQEGSAAAQGLRAEVAGGRQIYRGGNFGSSTAAEGQSLVGREPARGWLRRPGRGRHAWARHPAIHAWRHGSRGRKLC